ncbi:GDP-mannose pyrophosphorylase [Theileria orientalis]|uniref:mannose-1-phosphate guanylyltransferase n=1 Tax=Theileria orientalis TaxID=68886 RepID=A0A976SJG9_THEOR|nr:GDP-mannose pyrophosphorylase [Theileria orientalis]
MKAVILAGGFGTRIRPLTLSVPKPLIDFCNLPAVEYQIEACKNAGINHIIFAVSDYQNVIDEIKVLGEKYSIPIDFSVESSPLGTAGCIRLARDLICDDEDDCDEFITFNSDIICKYPLHQLVEFHRKNEAKVTILVTTAENPQEFGVILHDDDNKIVSFIEKPKDSTTNKVNAGVYVLSKEVIDSIPLKNYSIEHEFFPKYLKFGTTFAYHLEGYWADIGKPGGYLEAQNLYLTYLNDESRSSRDELKQVKTFDKHGFLYTCHVESPINSFEGPQIESMSSELDDSVNVKGPVLIHPTCVIGKECIIGPNVCIGPNVKIGNGCRIINSTLMKNVQVDSNCYIEGSIIGWDSIIGRWVRIEGLTMLGKGVVIAESLFVRGCIILPHKAINSSIYDLGQVII